MSLKMLPIQKQKQFFFFKISACFILIYYISEHFYFSHSSAQKFKEFSFVWQNKCPRRASRYKFAHLSSPVLFIVFWPF